MEHQKKIARGLQSLSFFFIVRRSKAQNFYSMIFTMQKRLNTLLHTSQPLKKRCRPSNWFGHVNRVKAIVESLLLPCFSSFRTASTWD